MLSVSSLPRPTRKPQGGYDIQISAYYYRVSTGLMLVELQLCVLHLPPSDSGSGSGG